MNKNFRLLSVSLLLIIFCIYSCKKIENTDSPVKREVTFSFEQKVLKGESSTNLKDGYLKEDSRYIVVTIEKSNGTGPYVPAGFN